MPAQIRLPIFDRDVCHELVGGLEEFGLADVDLGNLRQVDGAEVATPIKVRRQFQKLRFNHRVIVGFRIATLHARQRILGQLRLNTHHGLGFCRSLVRIIAQQLEGARNMLHVLVARLFRFGIILRVIVSVWKSEPALDGLRDDGLGVFKVLCRAEAEDRRNAVCVEDGDLIFEPLQVFDGSDAI